ncbi:hypothetical protein SGFS_049260 [Streptomyces graminofaciens]|uniref:Glycosyltransferase 2-like domain-containing protein n=1 Tax=Streptomyces graminofaciens TaxID=68212 RepID=A0ABN5VNA5_9ACTN|nr:bifunctional glycosyltransferase family 2 protein/CDP-glycerol:glycerophosphate glycerophosphotransferase [Streptomyces graminofaciens]BBC33632.1 hypothetical protein SGFS_049260 [Streptomyces graminofaciens]
MPRFSVIVPTHRVEAHLPLALDSILTQSFGDFELIPVHDAPDSPAGTLTTAYADRDTRVSPVQSPPSGGLGAARNTGIAAATGTYLLFLDGDDTLTPGALAELDARLRQTPGVDVLRFAHERAHWWEGGTTVPHPTGVHLPAWSAAYRRDFVAEHRLAFPSGHFTDLGWNGLVTLAADSAAELRSVCVRHLVRRQGSRLAAPGPHQLELLDQVELVLARATAEQGLSPTLFEQLFAMVLRTAARPERLPARARRAYFRRACHLYRTYRPAGFKPPVGSVGVQHRVLATGSYAAFRALRGVKQAATTAMAAVPRPRAPLTRALYAARRRLPLDNNLAVYCAYWGRGHTCNPAAVHAKARELAPHIRGVWLVEPEAVGELPPGIDHAVIGSRRYWEVLASAKYLVNNANFADAVVKRPGSVHLQTQHGTPLKTMGVDQSPYPVVAAASGSFTGLLKRVDRWDFNLSANRHSTETWERAFPGSYEQLEYGYPRNDVYYTATAEDVTRIRRELGIPDGRTALLYAPTHRDHAGGFDARLDLEAFCDALDDDFVVLLRAHYFYDRGGRPKSDSRVIDVTRHRSTEDLCLAADALITDYSSIMFDYANLDRPIVVLADDWDVYRETRGVTFDLPSAPPGHVARTERELTDLLRDGSYDDLEADALRAAFRERFCQFDDGRAAERVVRRVFLGQSPEALPPVVPLAERTPAPRPTATLVRS